MENSSKKKLIFFSLFLSLVLSSVFYAHTFAFDTVSVTATVTGGGGGGSSGGGGGGIVPVYPSIGVFFSGRGYPFSKVNILKDGQLVMSTVANKDSDFSASLGNLSSGNYTFSVYAIDKNGLHSSPFTFPIFINNGVTTSINGIFIAPTISVDKSKVKQGDRILISGQSASFVNVLVGISPREIFKSIPTDATGLYSNDFDTSVLDLGSYSTQSKALKLNEVSPYSDLVNFIVGKNSVLQDNKKNLIKCDLNEDGRCNLIDFSIAAFWYKRPLSPEFALREKKHLSGTGRVDLVDFSIMAFYWTG